LRHRDGAALDRKIFDGHYMCMYIFKTFHRIILGSHNRGNSSATHQVIYSFLVCFSCCLHKNVQFYTEFLHLDPLQQATCARTHNLQARGHALVDCMYLANKQNA